MIEFAALTYGLLVSFVLSALTRNHKSSKKNPAILHALGHLLCGMSAGAALILAFLALRMAIS
jgi:flagellar biosynthesis protein FliR